MNATQSGVRSISGDCFTKDYYLDNCSKIRWKCVLQGGGKDDPISWQLSDLVEAKAESLK